jgi:transcriptional regulator with XRE-family HTH domain
MKQLDEALDRVRRRKSLPGPVERRLLRVRAGLTQEDMAKCLGTTPAAVSRYESGDREPHGDILDKYLTVTERLLNEKASV